MFEKFQKAKGEKTMYGIVGLGRFGMALALELAASDAELLVIDQEEEKIQLLREVTENAYVIRTLNRKALMETGIQNCDVAVVCIGEQMDTSILTTLNLVDMGIPKVISKASSADHGKILEKLGAEVVYPEHDMAVRLASRLETSRTLDIVQLSEQINISKLAAPPQAVGKSVLELDMRGRFGLNIIAIEHEGIVMDAVRPDYVFRKDDILYVSGSKDGLLHLSNWIESN